MAFGFLIQRYTGEGKREVALPLEAEAMCLCCLVPNSPVSECSAFRLESKGAMWIQYTRGVVCPWESKVSSDRAGAGRHKSMCQRVRSEAFVSSISLGSWVFYDVLRFGDRDALFIRKLGELVLNGFEFLFDMFPVRRGRELLLFIQFIAQIVDLHAEIFDLCLDLEQQMEDLFLVPVSGVAKATVEEIDAFVQHHLSLEGIFKDDGELLEDFGVLEDAFEIVVGFFRPIVEVWLPEFFKHGMASLGVCLMLQRSMLFQNCCAATQDREREGACQAKILQCNM